MHKLKYFLPLALALACLLAFLPGLSGPFVHDDIPNLARVKLGPFSWDAAIDAAFRNDSGPLRRPLSNLSFAANYWIGGNEPWGFKLVNLLLHGVCGLLVYALSRELLRALRSPLSEEGQRFAALVAMVVWVLHPLQVSTALYVVQRMAQWSTLFLLLGFWLLARWLNRGDYGIASSLRAIASLALLSVLALLGKESGALAPLLAGALLLAWWPAEGSSPRPRLFLWLAVLLPLALAIAVLLARPDFVLQGYQARPFGLGDRLLTQSTVLFFYLKLYLLPHVPWMGLFHDDYPVFGMRDWQGWVAAAGWLAIVALALAARRRQPVAAFAVFWFLACHALESTVFPLEMVYEHRNYLALVGPGLWLGHLAGGLSQRFPAARLAWAIPAMLLFSVTLQRAHTWSSADLFFTSEYLHHPDSFRALMGVTGRYMAIGDLEAADKAVAELKSRRAHMAWPLLLDANMQCTRADYPVDWAELMRRTRQRAFEAPSLQMARTLTGNINSGVCHGLDMRAFNDYLELSYARAKSQGLGTSMSLMANYRAWVARAEGDMAGAKLWMARAAEAHPKDVEALINLAYFCLNSDDIDPLPGIVAELRRRNALHRLRSGYRIDEIEGFMRQAQADLAGKAGTP